MAFGLSIQPSSFTQFAYGTAAYTYLANSPLVSQITFRSNSATQMTTTKSYDFLNRLTQISSVPSGTGVPPVSYAYTYNQANQRTRSTLADGSYWLYDYDSLGQVRFGKKYWSDGTPVAGQQFEYGFDDIGNRKNRLIAMETLSAVRTGGKKALGFSYDARSRRQSLVVSNWSGSAWTNVAAQTRRFVYDDWNLLAALDGNNALVQSFVWGMDLSGSAQGAGGVSGLLAVNEAGSGVHFAAYDGNGNVMMLVKGSDGTVSAIYEYGPFGETVRATGPMAKANPMRFSTKYQDDHTDFCYYGYRFYSPVVGRWLSRDPIGERGELNQFVFVRNCATIMHDPLGKESHDFRYEDENGEFKVEMDARVSPSPLFPTVCLGGALFFHLHFYVNGGDPGMGFLRSHARFAFQDGDWQEAVTVYNWNNSGEDDWDNYYTKPLPFCPRGRQSGTVYYAAWYFDNPALVVEFDWSYACDCKCNLKEPLTTSMTFHAFPPVYDDLPPRPPRPGW